MDLAWKMAHVSSYRWDAPACLRHAAVRRWQAWDCCVVCAERTSLSDRPPVAVAGEASLALLAQDTLQAGYQAMGAGDLYQPSSGRLSGMTPFSAAAGAMPDYSR